MASVLLAASMGAQADTVDITVTGKIVETTCKIDNAANSAMTVDLGSVGVDAFSGAGSVGNSKPFELSFSGCPTGADGIANINIAATGTADPIFTNGFASTGDAKNVAIEILSGETAMTSNGGNAIDVVPGEDGSAKAELTAAMVQVGDTAPTVGSVNSVVTMNVTYS
ncbi:fimbrial protein [Tenebrionibacter intestinalis]|uniref:fimbrial protein n=1 Tax=Tenebrionibacter intestinalis TaxID=2799638 RepID=UPI001EE94F62|nr:fimbrial protein [Tenebrionibacter intestinalis]